MLNFREREHFEVLDRYTLQDVDQHTAGCAVRLTPTSKIRLITIQAFLAFKSSLQRI
jgi:hypothetical protein